jgi:hypothetical protein
MHDEMGTIEERKAAKKLADYMPLATRKLGLEN